MNWQTNRLTPPPHTWHMVIKHKGILPPELCDHLKRKVIGLQYYYYYTLAPGNFVKFLPRIIAELQHWISSWIVLCRLLVSTGNASGRLKVETQPSHVPVLAGALNHFWILQLQSIQTTVVRAIDTMLTSYSKTETWYAYAWCSQVYLKCDQVAWVQLEDSCMAMLVVASFPGYMVWAHGNVAMLVVASFPGYMVWAPGNVAMLVVASFSGYMVWVPGNVAMLVVASFPGYVVWAPGNVAMLVVASFWGYMVWVPGNEAMLAVASFPGYMVWVPGKRGYVGSSLIPRLHGLSAWEWGYVGR